MLIGPINIRDIGNINMAASTESGKREISQNKLGIQPEDYGL
jgi:hypothetical protein